MSRDRRDSWGYLDNNEVAHCAARAHPVACVVLEVGKVLAERLEAIVDELEART